jgi:hypothetical protein
VIGKEEKKRRQYAHSRREWRRDESSCCARLRVERADLRLLHDLTIVVRAIMATLNANPIVYHQKDVNPSLAASLKRRLIAAQEHEVHDEDAVEPWTAEEVFGKHEDGKHEEETRTRHKKAIDAT